MVENTEWLTENRTIFLTGPIDEESVVPAMQLIVQSNIEDKVTKETLQSYEPLPIKIFISSNGGDVYTAWGLIDLIETSDTPIFTYCVGGAMSAAFDIFIAGHSRFITEHSILMCHQISSQLSYMTVKDIQEQNRWLQYLQRECDKFIQNHTTLSKEDIKDITRYKKDRYFTANDAIEFGMADRIIDNSILWSC